MIIVIKIIVRTRNLYRKTIIIIKIFGNKKKKHYGPYIVQLFQQNITSYGKYRNKIVKIIHSYTHILGNNRSQLKKKAQKMES